MESILALLYLWLVPLWSALVLFIIGGVMLWKGNRWRYWGTLPLLLGAVALIPLPIFTAQKTVPTGEKPQQVIYRFDDHRYLVLIGYNCEGALWFIDKKNGIETEVVEQYFDLSFFKYIHPSSKYIAIPLSDLSAILVSKDGGRSFILNQMAHFSQGGGTVKYSGRPKTEDFVSFTVVDDRGYFMTKQGDLYLSSAPFGRRWGLDYLSLNALVHRWQVFADWDNFQNPPHQVPEVKNYTGWDHMKCNWDEAPPIKPNPMYQFQQAVLKWESYTLGAPIYYGLKAFMSEPG
ncbi:T6SS immunity protein Tli3 family protein [Hafnia paralvei]|uniref:T6SS immunity protein Tli3 family protein n=1 Tax=Hafnia paralvei TaxID=546367 RepID=UPI0038CF5EC5